MKLKKLLSIALSILMIVTVVPLGVLDLAASAATANGTTGVLRYDSKATTFDGLQFASANVDGDNKVDSNDAILILKYDAKIIDKLPTK